MKTLSLDVDCREMVMKCKKFWKLIFCPLVHARPFCVVGTLISLTLCRSTTFVFLS